MLLVTSGFGQGQYLSITNENPEDNGSNKIIRTTRIRKNGQIDVVFKSRFITDDRSSGGSLSNLNKSGGIIDEIQEGVDERSRGLPHPLRRKKNLTATLFIFFPFQRVIMWQKLEKVMPN